MARKLATSIPRIALTPAEAAAAMGVGPDFFDANVAPDLRLVPRGRKRLVPVTAGALGVVPHHVVHPGLLESWGCLDTQIKEDTG